MNDDLSADDKRRIQKHKLLQKFDTVKKNHSTAILLCLGLGMIGAHRRYLGNKALGMSIAVFWIIALLLAFFIPANSATHPLIYLLMLYALFLIAELFQITGVVDRRNDEIRKSLEGEFYV